ncbi:SHOCT domain-containing protein [Streptomyces sp. NPDC005727]|uniref:SHOCT domain-containing protein n=1 Tax=Streptomyces sp. NPDC005727 TaxID=3157053 RepID=UPI0033FA067B
MPGLLRGVARTAVVAGTATAVSNRVSRRQAGRWAQQDSEQQQYEQQQYAQQQQQTAPPPAPAAAQPAAGDDMTSKIDQLKQLADLKSQGVLTDEEFDAQKRRLLS